MWPGSRVVMWIRPDAGATTSRCICGAATARAPRSNTSNWRICRHCPTRRSPRSSRCWPVRPGGRRDGGAHRIGAAARARRRGGRWRATGAARPAGPAGPIPGPGVGVDHVPGGRAGLETGHPDRVGRHHPGRGPGRRRCVHRRGVRRDGLAARPPGRHREAVGGKVSGPDGEPVADRDVRPVLVLGDRAALRAGRPRLLPRRQERLPADRVRAAHRPRPAARSRSGCSPATPPTRPRSPPRSPR